MSKTKATTPKKRRITLTSCSGARVHRPRKRFIIVDHNFIPSRSPSLAGSVHLFPPQKQTRREHRWHERYNTIRSNFEEREGGDNTSAAAAFDMAYGNVLGSDTIRWLTHSLDIKFEGMNRINHRHWRKKMTRLSHACDIDRLSHFLMSDVQTRKLNE